MPTLVGRDDDIMSLEEFDAVEQNLKDLVYERLSARTEYDVHTNCLIYCGCWDANGQAKLRVGGRVYCLSRVTAWLYQRSFRLWGLNRAVRTCDNPACCNNEHIRILPNQAAAMESQRRSHRLGEACHRLTRAEVREIRELSGLGIPLEVLALRFGIRLPAVRAVVLGRTWPEKEIA